MDNGSAAPGERAHDPDAILIAEFEYAAQTAFQANEDRARVSSYYLLAAGGALAAIFGVTMEGSATAGLYWSLAAVFAVLASIGVLTVLQLARLRDAWVESARAMCRIKEYFQSRCPDAQLERAFAWTTSTIPASTSRNSMAFLLSVCVMVIDVPSALAAVLYLGLALGAPGVDLTWCTIGVVAGASLAFLQYHCYLAVLSSRRKQVRPMVQI